MHTCTVICSDGYPCGEPTEFEGEADGSWVCTDHAGLPKGARRPERKRPNDQRAMPLPETNDQKAIRLLRQQIDRLNIIPEFLDSRFVGWFDMTKNLLTKFLGARSNTVLMFDRISWTPRTKQTLTASYGESHNSVVAAKKHAVEVFNTARMNAAGLINSAIEHIAEFGVETQTSHDSLPHETPTPAQSGGIQQHFYGNVTIQTQALAADNAIQHVDQSSNIGPHLHEIKDLLMQSMEINGREVSEALQAVELIAVETKKPEKKRDWKSMVGLGAKLTEVVGKALDIESKIRPHLAAVIQFIELEAKHFGF